ncbi:replication protein A 70 kDa DNA-binding subunit [Neodiprion pinetum]|uniref:Replication protein A subunit n=1 Tax=Neodiprion lecontei TaxID=441921 RepID=A0A6J0CBX3_NEOLC|nr:replication protein A 70 kDa DNA-binding subunit [Neodiprion lecontei]XP_046482288.1 replication protein A 70 kDa DNA-binding subunit [Neodiprion pinetum]
MYELSEGALDQIMNGVEVEKPILQILGHKKLQSASTQERYRLLVSDGKRINSYAMLATQLNSLITNDQLTEFSVCQVNRYAISMINNSGTQKRVMVILNIDVKIPGTEVGCKIGNPTQQDGNVQNGDSTPAARSAAPVPKTNNSSNSVRPGRQQQSYLNDSVSSGAGISTTPIEALSPYQNRWVIRARVANKSAIKTWSNARGEGSLFSMDLVDETGEIRCTAFRDQCDKFYNMIEFGKIYYISRCQLKPANKQFSNLKNEYEMTMTSETEVVPCHDDSDEIPTVKYDFAPISEIDGKEPNAIIDVLGVCKSCSDITTVVARTTRKELKKRDVNLVDESNTMVTLTLWGTQADEFDGSSNPVVAVKGARLAEFNGGKSLSTLNSSVLQIDPDIPEAHRLRGWYNTTGCTENVHTISKGLGGGSGGMNGPWLTFKEAKDMQLGCRETPDYFIVKATINMIRTENSLYKACPTDDCKKKLIDQSNEMYRCEKCNRNYPNFKYRLLASINLADWTDNQWVTAFNEEAEKILGMTAQEIGELKDNDDEAFLEKFGESAFKTFLLKLRVKMENYSDENRLKSTVVNVTPLDIKSYNNHLIAQIKELSNMGKA